MQLEPPYLEVNKQALHWSVGGVDHQVEVELLDEEQLVLQDLFQNHFLPCRGLLQKVAHKLGAGNVELVHFARQVCTSQPAIGRCGRNLHSI